MPGAIGHEGAREVGSSEVGFSEVYVAEVGSSEVGMAWVGGAEVGASKISASKISASKISAREVAVYEIGIVEVGGRVRQPWRRLGLVLVQRPFARIAGKQLERRWCALAASARLPSRHALDPPGRLFRGRV